MVKWSSQFDSEHHANAAGAHRNADSMLYRFALVKPVSWGPHGSKAPALPGSQHKQLSAYSLELWCLPSIAA